MIKLVWNKRFEKKLEKYLSKHPETEYRIKEKLNIFIKNPYAIELQNHKLSGQLNDLRAITIDYNCRIIFSILKQDTVLLVSIGSHDEVY